MEPAVNHRFVRPNLGARAVGRPIAAGN